MSAERPGADGTPADGGAAPAVLGYSSAHAAEWLAQAGAHLQRGELDQAEIVLAEAAALRPDDPDAHRLKAVLVHLRGDPQRAARMLGEASARWPDHAAILNNLGGALRDAGDFDGAIAALRKSCEIEPRAPASWYNLGVALAGRGRIEEAEAAFARALERRPEYHAAQLADADMLVRLGRTERAAERYRALLQRVPQTIPAWVGLAGGAGAALSDAELATLRAVAAVPALDANARAAASFALGYAHEKRGEWDAAFDAFTAA
ncbi:MAG TPA: tetratricopeptide repeat protein, partial [Dokdonella sp.]